MKILCEIKYENVTPEQLVVTAEGILAYIEGSTKPILGKTLSFDQHGMYLKDYGKGPCWVHDVWCNRCGGCGVIFCPMNCGCYD